MSHESLADTLLAAWKHAFEEAERARKRHVCVLSSSDGRIIVAHLSQSAHEAVQQIIAEDKKTGCGCLP